MGLAIGTKMALAAALIAPLGLAMGMPFPLGLASLGARRPALVPWAWAVNGFASVVAAVLATVLAIHWGFSAVVFLAATLYLLAAVTSLGISRIITLSRFRPWRLMPGTTDPGLFHPENLGGARQVQARAIEILAEDQGRIHTGGDPSMTGVD
jgi:hypothetical protein